jgi:hypothetical protein
MYMGRGSRRDQLHTHFDLNQAGRLWVAFVSDVLFDYTRGGLCHSLLPRSCPDLVETRQAFSRVPSGGWLHLAFGFIIAQYIVC